jgi:light-regulated signal transduction histidine kinase (bacteriophytochrome)
VQEMSISVIENLVKIEKYLEEKSYAEVLTLCNSSLESVFKEVLISKKIEISNSDTFDDLLHKLKPILKLKVEDNKSGDSLTKFRQHLNSMIVNINKIRLLYSSSHGTTNSLVSIYSTLPHHHYKFIVDTTKTIVNFLVDSFFYQKEKQINL